MARKPGALIVIWNKDRTLSIYQASGGKCLINLKPASSDRTWLEAVAPFCEGWFGTPDRSKWRVRLSFKRS